MNVFNGEYIIKIWHIDSILNILINIFKLIITIKLDMHKCYNLCISSFYIKNLYIHE